MGKFFMVLILVIVLGFVFGTIFSGNGKQKILDKTDPLTMLGQNDIGGTIPQTKDTSADVKSSNVALSPLQYVVVYKTRLSYDDLVTVTLSADKSTITSYPDIKDARVALKPSQLTNGYLLDNRGISKDTAFLQFSYTNYSTLKATPSIPELKKNILDKNPISEMYTCSRTVDPSKQIAYLNSIINGTASKTLATACKKVL